MSPMRQRKHNSHDDLEMTTKQYKTLRYLVALWLKVAIHHKFRIIKNIIFLISMIGFGYYYISATTAKDELEEIKQTKTLNVITAIENVYNVNNYASVASEGKTATFVLKNLENQYLKDRTIPDDKKYSKQGVINKPWRLHCYAQLRKIIFLKARIEDIERTILYLNYNKTDLIYDIYAKAGYDEILSDLSNYYSRFLTEGQYSYVLKGFE